MIPRLGQTIDGFRLGCDLLAALLLSQTHPNPRFLSCIDSWHPERALVRR